MYSVDFDILDSQLSTLWEEILSSSPLIRTIDNGSIPKSLFALYLLETYHYTSHNAKNQALVGARDVDMPHKYRRYCYKHASEEVGHEDMALNDIRALGYTSFEIKGLRPLPATEIFIAYIYWTSSQGNPIQRLGYSYWAENCYQYIDPYINKLAESLKLKDSQLSFFISHSRIDETHSKEVIDIISRVCRDEKSFQDVSRVMVTSLKLMSKVMDEVYFEHERLIAGEPCQYQFLLCG